MLSGTLTTDPTVATTTPGTPTATARLLLTEDRTGQTCRVYVPGEAWGRSAEVLALLPQGDRVVIEGRITWRRWKCNGARQGMLVVSIGRVQALDGARV
jgi:single-stranded DNA-binding protein